MEPLEPKHMPLPLDLTEQQVLAVGCYPRYKSGIRGEWETHFAIGFHSSLLGSRRMFYVRNTGSHSRFSRAVYFTALRPFCSCASQLVLFCPYHFCSYPHQTCPYCPSAPVPSLFPGSQFVSVSLNYMCKLQIRCCWGGSPNQNLSQPWMCISWLQTEALI